MSKFKLINEQIIQATQARQENLEEFRERRTNMRKVCNKLTNKTSHESKLAML